MAGRSRQKSTSTKIAFVVWMKSTGPGNRCSYICSIYGRTSSSGDLHLNDLLGVPCEPDMIPLWMQVNAVQCFYLLSFPLFYFFLFLLVVIVEKSDNFVISSWKDIPWTSAASVSCLLNGEECSSNIEVETTRNTWNVASLKKLGCQASKIIIDSYSPRTLRCI